MNAAQHSYVEFWQTLRPDQLDRLDAVVVPEFVFTDPFRTLQGTTAVKTMLAHMFRKTSAPRFVVTGSAVNGSWLYLRWRFETASQFVIEGMSEVEFGSDGRALRHIDHWDAASQLYGKIPLLGALLRLLGRFV
jgi:steroid delta-isomerase